LFDQRLEEKTKRKYPHINSVTKDLNLPTNYLEFNQIIGNPLNRNFNVPQDMTAYQIDYHNAIQENHKVIVNKSRKIGATEAVNRSIAMNVFDRYTGHDIMIVAGNELNIAREILIRFDELFQDKLETGYAFKEPGKDGNSWKYDELIRRSSIHSQHPIIEFYNDTRIFCFAASKQGKSQTFRGPDDIICIFLSEAAHTGMLKDQPVMNALFPNLANRDYGDFIMESTPNGKRGFFYNYWKNREDEKNMTWCPLQWDYTEGLKYSVLSQKFIEEQKQDPEVDFEQEYCCKFTTTKTAAIPADIIKTLPPDEESEDLSGWLQYN